MTSWKNCVFFGGSRSCMVNTFTYWHIPSGNQTWKIAYFVSCLSQQTQAPFSSRIFHQTPGWMTGICWFICWTRMIFGWKIWKSGFPMAFPMAFAIFSHGFSHVLNGVSHDGCWCFPKSGPNHRETKLVSPRTMNRNIIGISTYHILVYTYISIYICIYEPGPRTPTPPPPPPMVSPPTPNPPHPPKT